MTNLQILSTQFKQSPWLDNLSRELLDNGTIEKLINDGVRGLTSNPTIFEKALTGSSAYDAAISASGLAKTAVESLYWQLAEADIQRTADLLSPVFNSSQHQDGYVSLEVSPDLAQNAAETITQAHELWQRVNRPNLMIKVPATEACLPAIKQLISDGLNINITLIFDLDRYQAVIDAYLSGLEARTGPLEDIHSVASFFVSRVDTEIDEQLEKIGTADAQQAKGKAAVAQARLAYRIFTKNFNEDNQRWAQLMAKGASRQRPLWASTSTKNPDYDPLMYIKGLVAPDTVNTIPDATIALIDDASTSITEIGITPQNMAEAEEFLNRLEAVGVDMAKVGKLLEEQGVAKFHASFKALLTALAAKMPE